MVVVRQGGPAPGPKVMRSRRLIGGGAAAILLSAFAVPSEAAVRAAFPDPLPTEPQPASSTLPSRYPQSWIFLEDVYTPSLTDARVEVVDVAAPTENLKAQIRFSLFADLALPHKRNEIYVAETFYSRLNRGERTDAISIYDPATLLQTGEVILPPKRGQVVPTAGTFRVTNDDRFGLVWNFTPASSVTVVDLQARKVLNEIPTPGCSQVQVAGPHGFVSLCADGGLLSVDLDDQGQIASQSNLPKFNDIDNDAAFMSPAVTAAKTYFVTFLGHVHPIDVTAQPARVEDQWSLLTEAEAKAGWRPSGYQIATCDDQGALYVLMQPNGREGSHKSGGVEVWIFDPATKMKLRAVKLQETATSIAVTHGKEARLVAASAETGRIQVYDAATGGWQRTLGDSISINPFAIEVAR